MTDKEVQLFILRHLEAGNTKADLNLLTDVPEQQRRETFCRALSGLKNQGFLCPTPADHDGGELWNAYVSSGGKAFLRENTSEPLVQTIGRTTGRWFDVLVVAIITGLVTAIINTLVTLYLLGKFG
jgi:hypothetical protein